MSWDALPAPGHAERDVKESFVPVPVPVPVPDAEMPFGLDF